MANSIGLAVLNRQAFKFNIKGIIKMWWPFNTNKKPAKPVKPRDPHADHYNVGKIIVQIKYNLLDGTVMTVNKETIGYVHKLNYNGYYYTEASEFHHRWLKAENFLLVSQGTLIPHCRVESVVITHNGDYWVDCNNVHHE